MPLLTTSTVNEKKTLILGLSFFNPDNVAVTPSKVTVSIYDVISGTAVRATTDLTGLDDVMDMEITSTENAIIDSTNEFETRIVTIVWEYGSTGKSTDEYVYSVKNLAYVS